jgi:hypothetical protein
MFFLVRSLSEDEETLLTNVVCCVFYNVSVRRKILVTQSAPHEAKTVPSVDDDDDDDDDGLKAILVTSAQCAWEISPVTLHCAAPSLSSSFLVQIKI